MNDYRRIIVGEDADLNKELRVALGHLVVREKNIELSFLGDPNVSLARKTALSNLLNDVVKHGVRYPDQRIDLLVLPEVSIPYRWANLICNWSRIHQIGVICGLEHRVNSAAMAINELLAALPFRSVDGTAECVPVRRIKKHYSPEEVFRLKNHRLNIPRARANTKYQLIQWRGVCFAIYNCYELTSVEDRAIFKGKVDFIVCSEFNKDVNYFSNIVESAARDLHCFVIQVNSAHFGDSRVVSPSKTENMNPLRLKGGDNQTFLTMTLPLSRLRAHQMKKYGLQKESNEFKPTPPNFNVKSVRKRITLGA